MFNKSNYSEWIPFNTVMGILDIKKSALWAHSVSPDSTKYFKKNSKNCIEIHRDWVDLCYKRKNIDKLYNPLMEYFIKEEYLVDEFRMKTGVTMSIARRYLDRLKKPQTQIKIYSPIMKFYDIMKRIENESQNPNG